jgi:hypothetical protein
MIDDDPTAFWAGLDRGLDTRPGEVALLPGGTTTTSAASRWAHRPCTGCGHRFRRGDRVIRTDDGEIRHLDPRLGCAEDQDEATADAGDIAAAAAFAEALTNAWHPGIDVVTLPTGHPLVARLGLGGGDQPRCLQCAATFRPGETVVVCPCRMGVDGRPCEEAVHRDPAAGLPCWEKLYPDGIVDVCPWRMERVPS